MVTASSIFINGLAGVFAGIGVLYLLMKLLAATAGRSAPDPPPGGPANR